MYLSKIIEADQAAHIGGPGEGMAGAEGQLSGGAIHDLNNLLAPILNTLELLQLRHAADPETADLVKGARQAALGARNLLRGLMNGTSNLEGRDCVISRAELDLSKLRILLVDDEHLVRISTADMLENLGAEVDHAGSAAEAMRQFDGGKAYDLVITDLMMPGKGGDALARELVGAHPGLPVLIVTGYGANADDANGWPCLAKPFRPGDLAEAAIAALTADVSDGGDSPD